MLQLSRILLTFIAFIFVSFSSYTQEIVKPKVVVLRNDSDDRDLNFFNNETFLSNLKKFDYFSFATNPGEFALFAEDNKNTSLRITLESGKTYYVLYTNKSFTKNEFLLIDSINAKLLMNSMNTHSITQQENLKHSKFRVDLDLGIGMGFDTKIVAQMNNGIYTRFGFGENFSAGVGLSYSIFKYLDLTTRIAYGSSFLIPKPNNISMNFSTTRWSLIPYYVHTFNHGTKTFKIGVGKDFYFNPAMYYDFKDLGGPKVSWTYFNTEGLQFSAMLLNNDLNNYSTFWGVRISSVDYQFDSGYYYPLEYSLRKPNGFGAVLFFGASIDLFKRVFKE